MGEVGAVDCAGKLCGIEDIVGRAIRASRIAGTSKAKRKTRTAKASICGIIVAIKATLDCASSGTAIITGIVAIIAALC